LAFTPPSLECARRIRKRTMGGQAAMDGRLQDKIALIAGAGCVGPGWGNGRAAAVRFAEEGATIFAVDRNADAMVETVERVQAAGGKADTHLCDVTDNA